MEVDKLDQIRQNWDYETGEPEPIEAFELNILVDKINELIERVNKLEMEILRYHGRC